MTVFLFPGQGSQQPGAAHGFADANTAAHRILEQAQAFLPDRTLRIMRDGPPEQLNDTRIAQPALLCAEAAATAYLESIGVTPALCAGHSLGEISALVAAGALAFEQALPLVCERARLMSENIPEGGMAAVLGMAPNAIEAALPENVWVANFNGPEQTIISGAEAALTEAKQRLKQAGAKRVLPLPVSGPFHSPFMTNAAQALAAYLGQVTIVPPKTPFLSSVTGVCENDPERIRTLLAEQLVSPVRWTDVMEQLADRQALEVGPGAVLRGLARRAPQAPRIHPADTPEACNQLKLTP